MVSDSADSFSLSLDEPPQPPSSQAGAIQPYRVLARKYRPQKFADLIGQDAMVRTLDNAIARERQIKGWSRRKKEALVALGYEALPALSRRGPARK